LITPPVTENILEGITRDSVSELALRELGLHVEERAIDRSELYICDELFFTGTAVGIEPIVKVDHRAVGDGNVGPVTKQLRQLYLDATRGHLRNYRRWLMPVHGTPDAQLKSEDWSELIPMVS
jgi:branched-chain amino acid aminotransferase